MKHDQRFNRAIERIDAANREDPRTELVDGRPEPREFLFAGRVYDWVTQLVDDPSEALLLAARAHTLRRWAIPRDTYPMTTGGYHQWRDALAALHANEAASILRDVGYEHDDVVTVQAFILKKNWPQDAEACALEDADCLVFLETKLKDYTEAWDERKMTRVLQRTLRKMTPNARIRAAQLTLGERERELVRRATISDDPQH